MGNIVLWIRAVTETKGGEVDAPENAWSELTAQQDFPERACVLWKLALSSGGYSYYDDSMLEQITLSKVRECTAKDERLAHTSSIESRSMTVVSKRRRSVKRAIS
jgi:hypothetical protein